MRRILFLTAVPAILIATGAMAADLPGPAPLPEFGPQTPVEFGSNWYLRLDLTYSIYDDIDISQAGGAHLFNETIDDQLSYGFGVGVELSNWLRTDLTVDYRPNIDITGQTDCNGPGCRGSAFVTDKTSLDSWLLLANAYADLGTWYGITPYVGGGIGAVYHETDPLVADVVNPAGVTSIDGSDNWEFAWALMAGAAVDVTSNLKIDAGYRYVDLGSAVSGVVTNTGVADPSLQVTYDDITAHEFRVGLRYIID